MASNDVTGILITSHVAPAIYRTSGLARAPMARTVEEAIALAIKINGSVDADIDRAFDSIVMPTRKISLGW